MKKISIVLLQAVVVLIGVAALAFMLVEPHFEGRNAHATLFEIYFKDPFLAYVYASSILFFVALHRAFILLRCVGQHDRVSVRSMSALRTIRNCMMTLVALIFAALMCLVISLGGKDDIAGGIAMGLFMMLVFSTVAISARLLERRFSHNLTKQ